MVTLSSISYTDNLLSATILLSVSYPPTYPSVAPNLDLLAAPDSPRHPHLDLSTDKPTLLSLLSPIIEENLGMAMIFTLVTSLKESAEQLIAERKGAEAAAREREMEKAEEEENRKFVGQMVTKESFLRWRDGFRLEMEERRRLEEERIAAERKKGAGAKEDVGKLTGRQIWERGLQGRGDEEDDVLDGMEKLKLEVV